jgi:hypothetical protein
LKVFTRAAANLSSDVPVKNNDFSPAADGDGLDKN